MKIKIDKSFQKDSRKIRDDKIRRKIAAIIQEVMDANSLQDISNLKKLKGVENVFRMKSGQYRIGLIIEGDTVIFVRILNRKDIYKYFPK